MNELGEPRDYKEAQTQFPLSPSSGREGLEESGFSRRVKQRVRGAISAWWHTAGPGSIEKTFADAHEKILSHIDGEDRQKAFKATEGTWRSIGKEFGIAATAIDFSIAGVLSFFSIKLLRHPEQVAPIGADLLQASAENRVRNILLRMYSFISPAGTTISEPTDVQSKITGRRIGTIGGIGALGVLAGVRPAHAVFHIAAKAVEYIGIGGAKTGNYIASGKAKEHAIKVGGAFGKGASAAARYAAEHPEQVRKTMETANTLALERKKLFEEQRRRAELLAQEQKKAQMDEIRRMLWTRDIEYNQQKYGEIGNFPEDLVLKEYQKQKEEQEKAAKASKKKKE